MDGSTISCVGSEILGVDSYFRRHLQVRRKKHSAQSYDSFTKYPTRIFVMRFQFIRAPPKQHQTDQATQTDLRMDQSRDAQTGHLVPPPVTYDSTLKEDVSTI